MTVFGWDASDYDWDRGPMDYQAAANDGIVFATHKATEGTEVVHKFVGNALGRAYRAGIPVLGAYHVVRSTDVLAQCNHFISCLDEMCGDWWREHPYFMLQVDLEVWPYDDVSASTGIAFCEALRTLTDKFIVMYASKGQYGDSLVNLPLDIPLWNANYGTNPAVPYREAYPGDNSPRWSSYSNSIPKFLQYGSTTTIGVQRTCDANAFRGSLDELKALVSKGNGGMVQITGPDPFGTGGNLEQAAQLRNGYHLLLGGYQPDNAGPEGVIARLERIEKALETAAVPALDYAELAKALLRELGNK